MKVVITDSNLGDGSHERAELGPGYSVEIHQARTEREVIDAGRDADALLVQWAPITARVFEALPRLRVVVRYGIGTDNIDKDAAEQTGVLVGNVDDYCIDEVADHASATVYAHNRRLVAASRSYLANGWTTDGISEPLPPSADPVGLAGFGRIGRAVAARLTALGFPVNVWDPFLAGTPDGVAIVDSLEDLARSSNHLSLHVLLNDGTRHIVDADILRALGPSGHLVNTARGALVDEVALLAALTAGELGFASLDVMATEPPVGVSEDIAAHPRVLVTPHIAYLSTNSRPELRVRAARKLKELLSSARRGEPAA